MRKNDKPSRGPRVAAAEARAKESAALDARVVDVVRTRLLQGFSREDTKRRVHLEFGWAEQVIEHALAVLDADARLEKLRTWRAIGVVVAIPIVLAACTSAWWHTSRSASAAFAIFVPVLALFAGVVVVTRPRDVRR